MKQITVRGILDDNKAHLFVWTEEQEDKWVEEFYIGEWDSENEFYKYSCYHTVTYLHTEAVENFRDRLIAELGFKVIE